MEKLTKKERLAIEYYLESSNQTDAVLRAYDCKDRNSARSLASRVFNKLRVATELAKRQTELNQKLADRNLKFVELVEKYAPRNIIAQKLAENILSQDKRVSDSGIEKYLRLRMEYPPERIIQKVYEKELGGEDESKVTVIFKGNGGEKMIINEEKKTLPIPEKANSAA